MRRRWPSRSRSSSPSRFTRRRTSRDPNTDVEGLPRHELPPGQLEDAIRRVRRLTARPLTGVGAGMTGIVFCDDRGRAYKVGRHDPNMRDELDERLSDEAEWLRIANQVPGLRARVVRLHGYDKRLDVLVRACPMPVETAYRRQRKLHDLWQEIGVRMKPYGWSAPEYKPDSFVITRSGPVLVDAGFAHRIGRRQLAYVQDIVSGRRRKNKRDRWSDLAYSLAVETRYGDLRPEHVRPTIARIVQIDPSAREWMV